MKSRINVDILKRDSYPAWTGFLDGLAAAGAAVLAYHYPDYLSLLGENGIGEPFIACARLDGDIVGILPGMIREGRFGPVYNSLPFFGPNAGVLCRGDGLEGVIHTALLNRVISELRDRKALCCVFYTPLFHTAFSLYEDVLGDCPVIDKWTQFLALGKLKFRSGILRNIRRAQKARVSVEVDPTSGRIDSLYRIYEENCRQYGIPVKPFRLVKSIIEKGCAGGWARTYFALLDGEMIAALIVLWGPLIASYFLPCTLARYRGLQPGPLLLSQALKDAETAGLRFWNWESSPSRQSGVYRFKKKWGSVESSYRIYVVPFVEKAVFGRVGIEGIRREYPFFYVYPFDLLE